jgi:polar amino acid transport system substrate-binding protein
MRVMKRLVALLILTLLCIPSAFAAQGSLNILTEEWGPITFEERGKAQGFAVDVVKAIQAQIKNEAHIQVVPKEKKPRSLDLGFNIKDLVRKSDLVPFSNGSVLA